jgi:Glycosyltransferase family 9 (heptosyltransferase)
MASSKHEMALASWDDTAPLRRTPPAARERTGTSGLARRALLETLTYASSAALGRKSARRGLVIYKCDALGDFILASGAIRYVEAAVQDKQVTLVVSELVAPYARLLFPRLEIIVLPWPTSRIGQVLHGALRSARDPFIRADVCLVLRHQRGTFDELMLRRLHARTSIGTTRAPFSPASDLQARALTHELTYPSPLLRRDQVCLELLAHARVVSAWLGTKVSAAALRPLLVDKNHSHDSDEAPMLIAPLGSAPLRDLQPDWLAEVLARALCGSRCPVRFVGTSSQHGRLQSYVTCARKHGISDVGIDPARSFSEFHTRVARARVVVSTETSTAHLAAALDRPLLGILGGGHFGVFAPWSHSARQHWLYAPLYCFSCNWSCRFQTPHCVRDLDTTRAAQVLQGLLSNHLIELDDAGDSRGK